MPVANPQLPALLGLAAENIPTLLKAAPRWAPWKAIWNEKRQKYDKRPFHPRGYAISTKRADAWVSYEAALEAFRSNPTQFTGVGYLMTGAEGLVGIDLDRCVSAEGIAPWALDIVRGMGSYAELSPSGKGLRIFTTGKVDYDWTNHDIGIEMYAGHTARFLTVTGARLSDSPPEVTSAPSAALAALSTRYAKERETADVITLAMPDLIPDLLLPDPETLDLPYFTHDFLREGICRTDRSNEIFSTALGLYRNGLDETTVFSMLANNTHVFDAALDKRHQDFDRAMMYLWVEHAQKAKNKAGKPISLDGFDALPELAATDSSLKFQFQHISKYTQRKPVAWAIKKVLPLAEMGVVYGESGAGKSFFTLDLVLAVARGTEWRGHKVKQGNVAYVCAEGANGFALRIRAYADRNKIDLSSIPMHVLGGAPNLMEVPDVRALIAAIKALGDISIVVLDTLAQVTPGADENSGKDMGRALSHCSTIHAATGAMVLLVAHAGKDASRGQRGWSGLKAPMDVQICVERVDRFRNATIVKLKDGEGEGTSFPFELDPVTLGTDDDNDPITSCVLKVGSKPPLVVKGRKEPVWQVAVLRVATELTAMGQPFSTQVLIENAVNQIPKDESEKKDRRRERVIKAITDLQNAQQIAVIDGKVVVS